MQITRDYVKAYLERYKERERECKEKAEQLNELKARLTSCERALSEVKRNSNESKQDKLIPLIMDLEKELIVDFNRLVDMLIERLMVIDKVNIRYRCYLSYRYFIGLSIKDIQKHFNESEKTVINNINKGIDDLVEVLNKGKKCNN